MHHYNIQLWCYFLYLFMPLQHKMNRTHHYFCYYFFIYEICFTIPSVALVTNKSFLLFMSLGFSSCCSRENRLEIVLDTLSFPFSSFFSQCSSFVLSSSVFLEKVSNFEGSPGFATIFNYQYI